MDYDNTNTGSSFKNDSKTEDWHADFRGSINVEGVDFWIDNKWNPPRDGKKGYMRHKLKRKQPIQNAAPQQATQPAQPAPEDDPFSEDVPW